MLAISIKIHYIVKEYLMEDLISYMQEKGALS